MSYYTIPPNQRNYVSRKKLEEELKKNFEENKYLALYGEEGSGKSNIAVQIARQLECDERSYLWFEFIRSVPLEILLLGIFKKLNIQFMPCDREQAFIYALDKLKSKQLTLIIDNLDIIWSKYDKEAYRSFIECCISMGILIILTFREKSLVNEFLKVCHVKKFNYEETSQLLEKLQFNIPEEEIYKIQNCTAGNPKTIVDFVEYCMGTLDIKKFEDYQELETTIEELFQYYQNEK